MNIAQARRLGALPASPRAVAAGALGLLPDDLAHGQKAGVHVDAIEVRVQWNVRLAAEVGDVHHEAAARHQHAVDLAGDGVDEVEIGVEAQIFVVFLAHIVGR